MSTLLHLLSALPPHRRQLATTAPIASDYFHEGSARTKTKPAGRAARFFAGGPNQRAGFFVGFRGRLAIGGLSIPVDQWTTLRNTAGQDGSATARGS